jgi:hypothetical protein
MINFGSMLRKQDKPRAIHMFFALALILMAFQCNKHTGSQCINSKINAFQNQCCDQGASVEEYTFQQEQVFVFNMGTCGADLPAYVLTSNCDTLGFLGGIAGNTTINGENFSNASLVGTVWSN